MFRFLLITLLSVVLLVACTVGPLHIGAKNNLQQLSLVALAEANQQTATTVDVVFIYDANLINALPKTGAAWFAKKEAFVNQYSQRIDITTFEMSPLSAINQASMPKNHSIASVMLIYVNMLVNQPVITLPSKESCVKITLLEQSVTTETCH